MSWEAVSATLAGTQLAGREPGAGDHAPSATDCARQCLCERLPDFALMNILEKLEPRERVACAACVNRRALWCMTPRAAAYAARSSTALRCPSPCVRKVQCAPALQAGSSPCCGRQGCARADIGAGRAQALAAGVHERRHVARPV